MDGARALHGARHAQIPACPARARWSGARVGEAVDVLAEDVGPGESYHRCRNLVTGAVGLYPAGWVRHPERGVPENSAPAC